MTHKECSWEPCQDEGTDHAVVEMNEKCHSCQKYHPLHLNLCANHLREIQVRYAAYNLALFAIGARPPYRKLRTNNRNHRQTIR